MRSYILLAATVLLLLATPALASEGAGHETSTTRVAFYLAVILLAAKLGGDLAKRLGQPAVLGELVAGVLLGNAVLVGVPGLDAIKRDPSIDLLAELGVLMLLFEVGLESTVAQMRKVSSWRRPSTVSSSSAANAHSISSSLPSPRSWCLCSSSSWGRELTCERLFAWTCSASRRP